MKKKNLLISASLALGLGVGVFAGIGLHNGVAEVNEVKAAKDDVFYYRGTIASLEVNTWATGLDAYKIVDGGRPLILNLSEGDEFKITPDISAWDDETTITTFSGDATDHWYKYAEPDSWRQDISQSSGNNITVNLAGTYALSIVNGALFIDYGTFYYSGTDNSWGVTPDSDHPEVAVNGGSQIWSLTKNEAFKIRYRNDDNGFKYGCFGYPILEDGDFYGSFNSPSNNNINTLIAGDYDVNISMINRTWTVRIYPHGVDPDETAYIYVLDKYGDLLSTSRYAYITNSAGQTTGMPGSPMETYEGTTHMYKQEYWVGMETVKFNNGTTYSQEWTLSEKTGKCLILDGSLDAYDAWNSATWVKPETAKFIENNLHFQNVRESDGSDGTACKGEGGYYDLAKKAYDLLDDEIKEEACSLDYVRDRLEAWAIANGKTFTDANSDGVYEFSAVSNVSSINRDSNVILVITVTAASIALLGTAGFFLLRRRKEDR